MKKLFAIIFAIFALTLPAFAEGEDVRVMYNGKYLEFTDASPVIIEGRTLLPFRSIFEQMGAAVDYDNATRTAKAHFGGKEISFSLDDKYIYSDGKVVSKMDVLPTVINGRTLVPLRALAEAGGLNVDWDNKERTVVIMDSAAIYRELEAACTDLPKLRALLGGPAMPYTKTETLEAAFDEDFGLNIRAKTTFDGSAKRICATIALDKLSDELKNYVGENNTATAEIIVAADKLYFKTDIFEWLAKINPADPSTSPLAKAFPADKWFMADYEELETLLAGGPLGLIGAAAHDSLKSDISLDIIHEFIDERVEHIMDIYTSETPDYYSAGPVFKSLAAMEALTVYKPSMESLLTVTDDPDGTASVCIFIPYAGKDMQPELGFYKATYSNGAAISSEIEYPPFKGRSTAAVGGLVEKVAFPENAINFADTLYTVMKMMN